MKIALAILFGLVAILFVCLVELDMKFKKQKELAKSKIVNKIMIFTSMIGMVLFAFAM